MRRAERKNTKCLRGHFWWSAIKSLQCSCHTNPYNVKQCTHASVCLHVFLQHDQQTASSDPLLGLCSALTQCKTCSENKSFFAQNWWIIWIIPSTSLYNSASSVQVLQQLPYKYTTWKNTYQVHKYRNYTLKRSCVLSQRNVEGLNEVFRWAGLETK